MKVAAVASAEDEAHAMCNTCGGDGAHLLPESGPQRGWARRHSAKTGHDTVVAVTRLTFYERSGS